MKTANKRKLLVKKIDGVKQVDKGVRRTLNKMAEKSFFKTQLSK